MTVQHRLDVWMGSSNRWLGGKLPRDNNFDLIRLFGAFQVVLFHTTAHFHAPLVPPVSRVLALFPGVPIFFFISGLLVTSSLAQRSLSNYVEARARRIIPALWLAFLLAVAILAYFRQIELTRQFALWVMTQITIFQVYNPGMFRDFGVGVVNGSLWTIPVEVGFYCILPILVWSSACSRRRMTSILILAGAASFAVYCATLGSKHLVSKLIYVTPVAHLWLFAIGALFYLYFAEAYSLAKRIPVVAPLAVYLAFGLIVAPHLERPLSLMIGTPLMLSAIFSLGVAAPPVAATILRGTDISYGVYVFHMLVVNFLVAEGLGGWAAVLTAVGATTAIAWCSWTFVESRALGRRPFGRAPLKPAEVAP